MNSATPVLSVPPVTPVGSADTLAETADSSSVWLIDQLCFTPWYTAALAQGLQRRGAQIRLIASTFGREADYFARHGLKLQPGPLNTAATLSRWSGIPDGARRVLRVAETLVNARALKRDLRRHPPDLIHYQQAPLLNHEMRSDLHLVRSAARARVPVVHTVHNVLPHDSGDRVRGIYGEFYRAVDHLICHSPAAQAQLEEEFEIASSKVTVIPHGPLFAPDRPVDRDLARKRLAIPADRRVALCQGVLAPYKGVDLLVEAWERCRPEWRPLGAQAPLLVIAGSGPAAVTAPIARAAARAEGSIRADLAYIPTGQLSDYYAAADLLVYPYRAITTSGALLTGLSYAKPILASKLPAFSEYLTEGDNAMLVPPCSVPHLAQALLALMREGPGTLGARLAEGAAQNHTLYRSWDELAARTMALYRTLRRKASDSRTAARDV